MAKVSKTKVNSEQKNLFSWNLQGVLNQAKFTSSKKYENVIVVAGKDAKEAKLKSEFGDFGQDFEKKLSKIQKLTHEKGQMIIVRLGKFDTVDFDKDLLGASSYARSRDIVASVAKSFFQSSLSLSIVFEGASEEEQQGALVGLEVGYYRYKNMINSDRKTLKLKLPTQVKKMVEKASQIATAVNISRHLINTPPNLLNPESYAQSIQNLFKGNSAVKVDVWKGEKLKKEKMNLLLAVGQASVYEPRFVHIKYRPKSAKNKPIAFVGKGLTFDSGGLDLKPAGAMRLMKKDMGGSAAVVALAYWVSQNQPKLNLDFYISIAENSVSNNAFRPSDVYQSRSGKTVEIHNTDAEGRLVLADALDVAVSKKGKDKPETIINIATLTGAMKVALGTEVTGFFSNSNKWANDVSEAGHQKGDLVWRMPLFEGYEKLLNTQFADINHCASNGFGGGITAALFLKSFVEDVDFVHFDAFGWVDRPKGALQEVGGNAQAVQLLISLLANK